MDTSPGCAADLQKGERDERRRAEWCEQGADHPEEPLVGTAPRSDDPGCRREAVRDGETERDVPEREDRRQERERESEPGSKAARTAAPAASPQPQPAG